MEKLFDFKLVSNKPLSIVCKEKGLYSYANVCEYIWNLPYGRNSNRSNYTVILNEKKGTCSTKHAFLAQLAIENNFNDLKLCLGIYKMNAKNTLGIEPILTSHKLNYIPEAHTYLKIGSKVYDFTRKSESSISFQNSILTEEYITPNKIGDYKINTHKTFIKTWIKKQSIPYPFNAIWKIREECILALSL